MSRATTVEITTVTQHDDFIETHDQCVLFFGSERCGHCHEIKPFFAQLAAQYPQIGFAHIEVTQVETWHIEVIPIFVFYEHQVPIHKLEGAQPDELQKLIASLV
jgi:thioredoxin-like negative regulator of GroEL